jgi:N-acetylneuraminic acid mutarotase
MKRVVTLVATTILLTSATRPAAAHFPWLAVDEDGKAIYFFGETPPDRKYKLPPAVTKAVVSQIDGEGQVQDVKLNVVESENFVGMKSTAPVPSAASLVSKVTYGVYHGSRLDYYTQHCAGKLPTSRSDYETVSSKLDLSAQVIDTESGVDVFVIWNGKPLVDAEVKLFCEEGHEEGSATTDQNGKVSFTDKQVEDGLNGIMVGYVSKDDPGMIGETEHKSVSRYLTATFLDPEDFEQPSTEYSVSVTSDVYPKIPETVTSFGGAVANNSLYIYGGHTGRAHEYYSEAQANTLWRLDLKNPKAWESLGNGPRLQGLAMVAHAGKIYRIGGFTAKNNEGEEKDLWSQAGVACFDPATKQWQDLPPLPEPRSSFDAAVLGDQIYVIGGWSMLGGGETTWLKTAYVLDLSETPLQWKSLPEPPFQRRALSVAAHDGKVYAIGGMQESGGPSTRVDVYDPVSQSWSRGPDLNGEGMDGFGSSAFAVGDELFVTTYNGSLQRLAADGNSWQSLQKLDRERFFHRLLPLSENQLLAIGGASMSSGKFEELDVIQVR